MPLKKGPLSAIYTQTVILNAEISYQCPLAGIIVIFPPLGLDSSLFYSRHPKDGWRPLKNEIGRVTFLSALLKEYLKDPTFVGFLEENLDPSISKTRHP